MRVTTALGWVQMQRHAQRRIETLSGGEKQRVALARALVDQPQCVLLDEPLSALDPHLRADTLGLLEEIQSRLNVTYLYITHDRDEALRIGRRIGVLNHGRMEHLGPPEEIYRRPRTAFVASFLGKINWLAGEVLPIGSARAVSLYGASLPLNGCQITAGRVKVGVRPEDLCVAADGWLPARVVSRVRRGFDRAAGGFGRRHAAHDRPAIGLRSRGGGRSSPGLARRGDARLSRGRGGRPMIRTGNGWLAVPAVVYLAVLFVGPVASVLAYSCLRRDFYGGVIWTLSGDAWRMATDAITLRILGRTLLLALSVTGLNLLIAYPCASLLSRLPRDQRTMWVLVISFPLDDFAALANLRLAEPAAAFLAGDAARGGPRAGLQLPAVHAVAARQSLRAGRSDALGRGARPGGDPLAGVLAGDAADHAAAGRFPGRCWSLFP